MTTRDAMRESHAELLEQLISVTNRFVKCMTRGGTDLEFADDAVRAARTAIDTATRAIASQPKDTP